MNMSVRDAAHWCVLRATAGRGCIDNTCSRDLFAADFILFLLDLEWYDLKWNHPSHPLKGKWAPTPSRKWWGQRRREGAVMTLSPPSLLLIWGGQSEHPLRSSVNHITLNHTCWAPGCRLQIHQRSETTLSVAGAVVSIGQKMSWLYRDSQTSDATSVT